MVEEAQKHSPSPAERYVRARKKQFAITYFARARLMNENHTHAVELWIVRFLPQGGLFARDLRCEWVLPSR